MPSTVNDAERQPLLPPAETQHKKKHFNLVGLSPSAFWILVRPARQIHALLIGILYQCVTMWMCAFLAAVDGTVIATLIVPIASSFEAASLSSWLGTS
jgi:uncharacterized membrane protein